MNELNKKGAGDKPAPSKKVELPNTLMVTVVGTGKSLFIKKDKELTMHRNVAEKLIKKGTVKLK